MNGLCNVSATQKSLCAALLCMCYYKGSGKTASDHAVVEILYTYIILL